MLVNDVSAADDDSDGDKDGDGGNWGVDEEERERRREDGGAAPNEAFVCLNRGRDGEAGGVVSIE